jgi:hypothetical protein
MTKQGVIEELEHERKKKMEQTTVKKKTTITFEWIQKLLLVFIFIIQDYGLLSLWIIVSNSILFQLERPKFLIPVSKPERETPHFTSAQILVYSGQHQPACKFRPVCKYAYFLFLFLNLEKAKAVKQMIVLIVYVSIKFSSFM